MDIWSIKGDGYAEGPAMVVDNGDRPAITVAAVWTDEDGVCVTVDAGDEPVPAAVAHRVCAAVMELAMTPAPEVSSR